MYFFTVFSKIRTFSRVVLIPFNKLPKRKDAVMISMEIQATLKEALPNLLKSVGVVIELHEEFKSFRKDKLFYEAAETVETVQELEGDIRAQCNYSLLLYSTLKVQYIIFLILLANTITQKNHSLLFLDNAKDWFTSRIIFKS